MSFCVVIPARYHSSRLPAKPLVDICGMSMLERVYAQACKSNAKRVYIATDHAQIYDHAITFCENVIMTREDHATGTDRLEEVVTHLKLKPEEVVVNVQGDEPLIPPELINQVAENLISQGQSSIATLAEKIETIQQLQDPNAVKLVRNAANMAMYFSRAPIPWDRNWSVQSANELLDDGYLRHIGLYAYRVEFLKRYVTWPQANAESLESLEQLRALHHGEMIHVEIAKAAMPGGVDTIEDLALMRKHVAEKGLVDP